MSEEGRIQYSSLKIALITIQLLCTALFSGILFGWAPFQLIMINEGLYACDSESTGGLVEDENDEYNSNQNSNDEKEECVSQQTNLNLLFTIATSTFLISSLFIGIFVDHYGPTRTVILVSGNPLLSLDYLFSHPSPLWPHSLPTSLLFLCSPFSLSCPFSLSLPPLSLFSSSYPLPSPLSSLSIEWCGS